MLYNSFINIMILIIYIAVGYFCGLKRYINVQINEGINKIVLNICLPCMILSSFKSENNYEGIYEDILILFILYVVFRVIWYIISLILFRSKKDPHFSTNRFLCLFPNAGYMGMPMTQAVFGSEALMYNSIYMIFFNIVSNSLGAMIYKGKINIKGLLNTLINPTIIAAFLGVILFILKFDFPLIISKPIDVLGSMTTPLSFMTLGYTLTKSSFKGLFKRKADYLICILKLLIIPLSAILIFRPILGSSLLLDTFFLLEAMPVAAVAVIFSNNYKSEDSEYASKIVFLSTIMSLITIPFMTFVIEMIS